MNAGNDGKNRLLVALGSVAAIALLFGAFVVVWLLPRGPVTGFRVTNIVNVKVRDTTKAGKLIDDLVASGANTVYGLSFSFSDPSALMKQAREQAMKDAQDKAAQLARLGNVTLGAPIMIQDGGSNTPPPVVMASARDSMAAGAAAPPTAINPGQQEIREDVSVLYAIK